MKTESIKATTTILRLKNGLQNFTFPTSTQVLHHVDHHLTIHKLRLQMARIDIQIQIKLSLCGELRPWTPRISWASILEAEGGALSLVHQWQWFNLNGTRKSNQLWSLEWNFLQTCWALFPQYSITYTLLIFQCRIAGYAQHRFRIHQASSWHLSLRGPYIGAFAIDGPTERNATRTAVRGQVIECMKSFWIEVISS
jgi:hypothetical protein